MTLYLHFTLQFIDLLLIDCILLLLASMRRRAEDERGVDFDVGEIASTHRRCQFRRRGIGAGRRNAGKFTETVAD